MAEPPKPSWVYPPLDKLEKRRYLMSLNTKEMPGKIILQYVEFTKVIVDANDKEFANSQHRLVDPQLPDFQALKDLLRDTPKPKPSEDT